MKENMNIEICANSYQSAINAQEAGANRIELCAELAVGGITPSYGFLKKVLQDVQIPVHVLIRPRSGDFTYSDTEFSSMKEDILLCKKLGCKGIVSGVLNIDNSIDIARTKELIELSKPLSFTFHRAFDWLKNPIEALQKLEKIGVDRILTSGQKPTAKEGINLLIELQKAATSCKILPGGGINENNINLFQEAGFSEIHFSATSLYKTIEKPKVSMNSQSHFDETLLAISNIQKIKNCIDLLSNET